MEHMFMKCMHADSMVNSSFATYKFAFIIWKSIAKYSFCMVAFEILNGWKEAQL